MKTTLYIITAALMVAALSCTKVLDSPTEFALTGSVELSEGNDFSGITIELYELAEMDTAVTNLQARFPSVGFPITQAAIFDHREHSPVYSTTTDENGEWRLGGITQGEYNLVASKEGYGWKYAYNVTEGSQPPVLELKPEIEVNGILDAYTIWGPDQHYVVTGDISVPEGGQLRIDKGTVVRFDGNYGLDNFGTLTVTGEADAMVWFTHNEPGEGQYWRGVENSEESTTNLYGLLLSSANIGFINFDSNLKIEHSIITKCKRYGISVANNSFLELTKSFVYDNSLNLYFEVNRDAKVEHCFIFSTINDSMGIRTNTSKLEIKNDIFKFLKKAISVEFEGTVSIKNNYFQECNNSVVIGSAAYSSHPQIQNNTFTNNSSWTINIKNHSIPEIKYNNFLSSNNYVVIHLNSVYLANNFPSLDLSNNYWNSVQNSEIDQKIVDLRTPPNGEEKNWQINYIPVSSQIIDNAYPN